MRVADRLRRREESWRELDQLLDRLARRKPRGERAALILRLGELYRSACADLMLAEAHDLPRETVAYLHGLVGRAHNAVYRAQGFRLSDWSTALFETAPRQLRADPALRLAALAFFGAFLLCGLLAAGRPDFAPKVLGEAFVAQMDAMYADPSFGASKEGQQGRSDTLMAGFYIQHNTTIGLQCFAWGLALGLGSLYQLLSNGVILGTVFGHMAVGPDAGNFYTFVTAHGPFELTAIVFSGAAGLRLGWGLIDTQGQTRLGSLRREARGALPTVGAAVVLFVLAAFLEGYVSASALPYSGKATAALVSAALLAAYLGLGGRARARGPRAGTDLERSDRRLAQDRTLVQIRERSFVDLLDLALVVVRARPKTLGLAALAGALPFAALNLWLTSGPGDVPPGVTVFLLLFEAPWATIPMTLVLGAIMFGTRPRVGPMLWTVLRSLPSLLLFQLLLRGVLVITIFFYPLIPARLAFLNEVILLERQRWPVVRRSSALCERGGGELFGQWLAQVTVGTLFVLAFWLGTKALLDALTKTELTWDQPDWGELAGFRFQLAAWVAIEFFGVVRFLTYLDRRIRLEGWEVELRLRAVGRALREDRPW